MATALDEIKQRLRVFAAREAESFSPLYAHLATQAAEDDEIAGLLAVATDATASAELLLATAHRLVQANPIHPLTRYYPSLSGFNGVDGETWPLFREFLLERADKAREIIAVRRTETNEVMRAATLFPAVAAAAKQAGGKVALLELGCGAGLLLGLDKFGYHYQCDGGETIVAGPAKAPVGLHCALSSRPGAVLPKLPKKLTVTAKVGVDTRPIDVSDEDELAWLEACVWADQLDRIRLLRAAAAAQRKSAPELISGDAVEDLETAAARTGDGPLVVLTCRTMSHIESQRRTELLAALGKLAASRPVWWVSDEPYEVALTHVLPGRSELSLEETEQCTLGLTTWRDGEPEAKALAQTSVPGNRMTWLAA